MRLEKTQISTLRVQGTRNDHPGLRLALSRLLDGADLRLTEMSPSAILIVRQLADPLPGHVAPSWRAMRVDATWERATKDALAGIYRRAARLQAGYVSASAEAVLFTDEAEMLACLALDTSRGEAQRHWWWHALLRTLPSPSSAGLTKLLCGRAEFVPAALHYLVERGSAMTVLEALSPQQAMAVLSAMGQAYGIADFGLGPTSSGRPSDTQSQDLPQAQEPDDGEHLTRISPSSTQLPRGIPLPAMIPPRAAVTAPGIADFDDELCSRAVSHCLRGTGHGDLGDLPGCRVVA
jgi:hypothetical protein